MPPEETKRALIVVRTYPTPSTKGVEVSCTAAITNKGEWLRLFPVPWRLLDADQRFRKYQWVEVTVTKASDPRPESYKLKPDGVRIVSGKLGTANDWQARKAIVLPLQAHCLCCLVKKRNSDGYPTLGIFRPRSIDGLVVARHGNTWSAAQLAALRQGHLFLENPTKELEKIPFKFSYKFTCEDADCKGHRLMCADWEMAELYRKCATDYGNAWEEKFRQRYETEMIHKNDTHFYVGTVHGHPGSWIIVGLFYPPHPSGNLRLFD
ncbi:MAG: hypothetical protein ACRD3O_06590 [Terriglobia bacterium]